METIVSQYLVSPEEIVLDLRSHLGQAITLNPQDGADDVSTSTSLMWHSLSGAQRFVVQVFSDSLLSERILSDTTTQTATTFLAPVARARYYWRVRGHQPGEYGPWSAVKRFATRPEGLLTTTAVSPENGAEGLSGLPALTWLPAPGASKYRIQIALDPSFDQVLVDVPTLTGVDFVPEDPLEYSRGYYWRVRAGDKLGWGSWSETWYFHTGTGVTSERPTEFGDLQLDVFPNPASTSATITVQNPEPTNASITVWDVRANLVGRVYRGMLRPGARHFRWVCSNVSTGLYLVRLDTPERSLATELIVLH
jgi:hypothetical protein